MTASHEDTQPDIVHTSTMDWQHGTEVLASMAPAFRAGLGPEDRLLETYGRYKQKTLRLDPITSARADLIDLAPGYRDLTEAYHDSVEECLVLSGSLVLSAEGAMRAGDYFWRPPGWVHAATSVAGFSALLLLQGSDPTEGSGPASRVVCPDDAANTNQLVSPEDPRAVGPRGWVQRVQTSLMPWEPGWSWGRTQLRPEGFDLDRCAVKMLSRNVRTGAQTLLLRLDEGYRQAGPGTLESELQLYVVSGEAALGEHILPFGSYVHIPAATRSDPLTATRETVAFIKIAGPVARHAA